MNFPVILRNKSGNFDIVKNDSQLEILGADFQTLDPKKSKEYGVVGGVLVKKINSGALYNQTRMKDGFVILSINGSDVKTVEEMRKAIGNEKSVTISGFYPGYEGIYEYPISLDQND